ncbi:MAG TPA: OmpA family protein [Hyphomonadaceae bacterium]|jgi:outer membrane protein OmpA-like peptidoglycan-associated protein|nr:OmpA family protein [Hyphomonadaceae bacterium]
MKSKLIGLSLGLALAVLTATSAAAYQHVVGTVYFDWNSSKLNAKAMAVVKEWAPKAKKCESNGVRVVGHTDMSHTFEVSSVLATDRAKAVRDALVKLGVADSAIGVVGHSQAELAKPTANGVKEPLNNRAEIILVCD